MKCTVSAMSGDGVVAHNRRAYIAENVDAERTHLNVEYCYTPIRQVYHELFDEALAEYNAKQTRQDRMIEDYYEKIRSGKQEKPFYEVIFQIGNKDDMSATGQNAELARTMLDEFMKGFQERNPNLQVFSAHLHMDEATPHLHIDFVPFTTGSKRGLSTRVSLKKALAAQGIKGEGRSNTERSIWIEREKERLAEIMLEHGVEWDKKGEHREHLDVLNYKKEQRAREVAELEQVKAQVEAEVVQAEQELTQRSDEVRQLETQKEKAEAEAGKAQRQVKIYQQELKEFGPAIKNMERMAQDFSDDPDELLPEAGTLETGKAYREKKAMPLLAKIVKVLRSLYTAYVNLVSRFNRLQERYEREQRYTQRLEGQLQDAQTEIRSLRATADKYELARHIYGEADVDSKVETICRQKNESDRKMGIKKRLSVEAR